MARWPLSLPFVLPVNKRLYASLVAKLDAPCRIIHLLRSEHLQLRHQQSKTKHLKLSHQRNTSHVGQIPKWFLVDHFYWQRFHVSAHGAPTEMAPNIPLRFLHYIIFYNAAQDTFGGRAADYRNDCKENWLPTRKLVISKDREREKEGCCVDLILCKRQLEQTELLVLYSTLGCLTGLEPLMFVFRLCTHIWNLCMCSCMTRCFFCYWCLRI